MIRKIKENDIVEINKINEEELGYTYPLDKSLTQLKKIMNDPSHHYLAVYEDDNSKKILGYVHAEAYEEIYNDPALNILAIAVLSSCHHSGIGTQLIRWLENKAVENGFKSIKLNSGISRKSAHKFYEHIGYIHVKDQKKFIKLL